MSLQHSPKPFWLYKFSNKHVSVWCQKKYLHCTSSWRPRTAFLKQFEIKCLYISIYLLKNVRDVVRSYLVGVEWVVGGGLNSFLKAARCLGLAKCFTTFRFNWNFWKFNYFSSFWYFYQNTFTEILTEIFPDNLDFKGKIVVKFIIRSHFLSKQSNMTKTITN